MRIVIQRVLEASVWAEKRLVSEISQGLVILIGVHSEDNEDDIYYLVKKAINLRVFNDQNGLMNLSVKDKEYDVILVSQFTLYAYSRKGNRPSFTRSAKAPISIPLYNKFVSKFEEELGRKVGTGIFGADMKVSMINDGPVTIILDSKEKSF